MGSYEQKITLCWDCANAIGKCPWSKKLVPVKNWVAKRVRTMSALRQRRNS